MILHGPDNPGCRFLYAFFIESAGGESTAFSCFCACVVYDLLHLCIPFRIFVRISAKDCKKCQSSRAKMHPGEESAKLSRSGIQALVPGSKRSFRDPYLFTPVKRSGKSYLFMKKNVSLGTHDTFRKSLSVHAGQAFRKLLSSHKAKAFRPCERPTE